MNNYNFLEKILHRLALSSQLMREVTFDLDSKIKLANNEKNNHVFITGLARSGTTILLNAIYQSDFFASLTYADMPFVLAPNLWSKISFQKNEYILKERAHGDGIKFGINSPEAFEEVFWKTFNENEPDTFINFKIYIDKIRNKYNKERYLSKNNQNLKRINLISKYLPEAKILIPFREPIQHAYSLLTQHKKFIEYSKIDKFIGKYMKLIGHTEFGPNYIPIYKENLHFLDDLDINHWIEQWYIAYNHSLKTLKDKKNIYFLSYEKLCNSEEYWLEILNILDIKNYYKFNFLESKKEIELPIENKIKDKAFSVFNELNKLILD